MLEADMVNVKIGLVGLFVGLVGFGSVQASEVDVMDEWLDVGVEAIDDPYSDDGIGEEELLDLQKWECSSANKFRKWNDFSCSYEPTKK